MRNIVIRILNALVRFIYGPGPSELGIQAGIDMMKTFNEEIEKALASQPEITVDENEG